MLSSRFTRVSTFCNVPWLARTTSCNCGTSLVGSSSPVCSGTALSLTTIQVHEDLTQHTGRRQLRPGSPCSWCRSYLVVIFMITSTGARHALGIGNHANSGDVADVHAFQAHRSADAQATRVVHVSANHNFLGEQTGGAGHDEDENGERDEGDKDGQSNPELRPFHLFFAWHALPIAPWTRLPHGGNRCRLHFCELRIITWQARES